MLSVPPLSRQGRSARWWVELEPAWCFLASFFSVDSHLADFVLQATFLTSLKPLALLSTNPQERQLVWVAVSRCGQSPGTGALARLNRTQHTPVSSCLYHPQTFQPGPSFQKWTCSPAPGEAPSSFNPLLSSEDNRRSFKGFQKGSWRLLSAHSTAQVSLSGDWNPSRSA